ncbi:MAG TPA: FUSC family protein [Aliidongia sp.]|nr:FUSC family protein [Aliidongia sp.]
MSTDTAQAPASTDRGQAPASGFLSFLREELAPRPGRLAAVARISAGCTLVVAIAMVYQIPLPAYMAYAVFLVSKGETASTLLTGVAAALAFTIAIALTLTFYTLDASEPALRLPLMALSTFIAMFLVRTSTLGPIAFLAGFVLVLSQTLLDRIPSLEALTRLVLWLWVVVMVPVAVTVILNLLIGQNPARLARRTALTLLRAFADALVRDDFSLLHPHQDAAIELIELRQRAEMFDRSLHVHAQADGASIEALAEFMALFQALPPGLPIETRLPMAEACEACARALERNEAPALPLPGPSEATMASLSSTARPIIVAMGNVLARLGNELAARRSAVATKEVAAPRSLLFPDAFSNPDHARYALKTTIAVMAAYIIYSGLDWPGISTAITTCFFVALGSLGETVHKLTLRLAGALIGGLAGGLCIVYLLPQMTDIGQLCLLIAVAAAACAWVATASELLSYAGMQIAFAFFLGVLQDYGPSTDLTVLRDRIAGIFLGNILMSVVFSVLWSTSAVDRARATIAKALRSLAGLLADGEPSKSASRLAAIRALAEARRFTTLAVFELRLLPDRTRREALAGSFLGSIERLAAAAFTVVDQQPNAGPATHNEAASAWLNAWASRLMSKGAPSAPVAIPAEDIPVEIQEGMPLADRAAIEARAFLQAEIVHAGAVRT